MTAWLIHERTSVVRIFGLIRKRSGASELYDIAHSEQWRGREHEGHAEENDVIRP